MPLAFQSRSHGQIAFGFFNIESDMLLLERLFFFADQFCEAVIELCQPRGSGTATVQGWRLPPAVIGNLHGAIAGVDHTGFIGATYARWPFPHEPGGFKQAPEGHQTQAEVTAMIERFGTAEAFELAWRPGEPASLAEYSFSAEGFGELVAYVDRGGYPMWRDALRPPYVRRMTEACRWALATSSHA